MKHTITSKPVLKIVGIAAALLLAGATALPAQTMTPAKAINAENMNKAPYLVTGGGINVAVIENEGKPDKNHTLLKPNTGAATINTMTPAAIIHSHACAVVGVIGANALGGAATTGVARGSTIYAYSHTASLHNLQAFFSAYAASALGSDPWYISNHSYGSDGQAGWLEKDSADKKVWVWYGLERASYSSSTVDEQFGWYGPLAMQLDTFCAHHPEQIAVFSAGNYAGLEPPASAKTYQRLKNGALTVISTPRSNFPARNGGAKSYDCLEGFKTAKNGIMVGALHYDKLTTAWTRASFSSTGPTDDGRVKPDVMAFGDSMQVLIKNNGTQQTSGTSFSTPAVTGALTLLAQMWGDLGNDEPMRAATARALLCHTATDLGNTGPDYHFGWGKVDTKKAADMIIARDKSNKFALQERTLKNGTLDTIYIKANKAGAKVSVTIAWTDPAGTPKPMVGGLPPLNDRTPMLVNDLDLRVYPISGMSDNQVGINALPWHLDYTTPESAATRKDNTVDNIEQVNVTAPATFTTTQKGVYMIVVKHKGQLRNAFGNPGPANMQEYSIAISGANEYFPPPAQVAASSAGATSAYVSWRKVPNATGYDVEYRKAGENTWQSKGTVINSPAILQGLSSGTWTARVRARRGTAMLGTWSTPVIFILGKPPVPTGLVASSITSSSAQLKWEVVPGATAYQVAWAPVTIDGEPLTSFTYKTVTDTKLSVGSLPADEYIQWFVQTLVGQNQASDWGVGDMFVPPLNCSSYEPGNNDYSTARVARLGEVFSGLICKNDVGDYHRISSKDHQSDRYLYVEIYPHPRPYTVHLWRYDKVNQGPYSIVANTTYTLSPDVSRVIKYNTLDFNKYDYWIQVVSSSPATIYDESEAYSFFYETRNTSPYGTTPADSDNAPGLSQRGDEPGGSLIEGASLQSVVRSMADGH